MTPRPCLHCRRPFSPGQERGPALHCRRCQPRVRTCRGCGLKRVLTHSEKTRCCKCPPPAVRARGKTVRASYTDHYLNDPERLARIERYAALVGARKLIFPEVRRKDRYHE